MRSRSRQHVTRRETEQVEDELVRVLGLDSERGEDRVGEVLEVHRYDDIRSAANGCSRDMRVAWTC